MPGPSSADLRIGLLDERHDRYLKTQASQDVRRKANAVFVLSEVGEPARVLGDYTLCAMALSQGDAPEAARKSIPRYPLVSATLTSRLAVATARQGQRLGAVLLADASRRAFDSAGTVGASMVVVDALDETAAGFYAAHGFVRLPDSLRLVLPMRLMRGRGGGGVHLRVGADLARLAARRRPGQALRSDA